MKRFAIALLIGSAIGCNTHATVAPTAAEPHSEAEQSRAAADATSRPSAREWTILLYAAVDNDWERDFMRDLEGHRAADCRMCRIRKC